MNFFKKIRITNLLSAPFIMILGLTFMVPCPKAGMAQTDVPTLAKQVMITELHSGRILMEKGSQMPMKPASMAKVMTIYIACSRIAEGSLSFDDSFIVSEKAWKMGGSRSFLNPGKYYTLKELLYGVIVQSGNDAAVTIAEGISGSEENFAAEMNLTAQKLGMKNSHFVNASGWPHPDLTTTAEDLNILASALIRDFPVETYPELYPIFSVKSYTLNNIKQGNRNPLLYGKTADENGVDGLKTGHTEESGYGLIASAQRNGMRVIMVLNGMTSKKERATESRRLIEFALREFKNYRFFEPDQIVDEIDVWLGDKAKIMVQAAQPLQQVLSRSEKLNAEIRLNWISPVSAPIAKGQELGTAVLVVEGKQIDKISLLAADSVEALGFFDRLGAAVKYLIFGAGQDSAQPSGS